MIEKILIANRGEIAVRIIRTCREMGIASVAVYSKADENALHVSLADEAVCIGRAAAADSYLNMNNIIQAAVQSGCDAIHPGFGFLSENALFARLVQACGLIFIGPDPDLIECMGNKQKARTLMEKAGVPVTPGSRSLIETAEAGMQVASEIGYPVMIKAASGGGGRGMRAVYRPADFEENFSAARQEAVSCFGDGSLLLEKLVENARHIEIQVVGDSFGNILHLYERDCSFQFRNQKMMEEAPGSGLDENLLKKMYAASIQACKAIGYTSLGTLEFLVQNDQFYFMEMNTRIQVEHPVTEMITGLDLVKLQIQVASGLPLALRQQDIQKHGWALEVRINAQDPKRNLAPCTGVIDFLNLPGGPGVRTDNSLFQGSVISPFYDSMLAKIIVSGSSREECICRMRRALEELVIDGIESNDAFLYFTLHQSEVLSSGYSTSYAARCLKEFNEHESVYEA